MAKQRRPTARAAASKTAARPKRPRTKTATKTKKTKKTKSVATRTAAKKKTAAKRKGTAASKRGPARAPVVKIREAYLKALARYEKGLKALQRKNYDGAAAIFREVLRVPEERELHERARLYLNVCERESGPKAKVPRTVDDRIFAATLALNRRDVAEALMLLRSAASSRPADDHVQYMLALTLTSSDEPDSAIQHLKKAIELNPDNRLQAMQEPDFESIRGTRPFLDAIKTPVAGS
jgi:tetratricopeptide (TPR) repeat protein